jgi:calcium release-activated calcium channel protein 1
MEYYEALKHHHFYKFSTSHYFWQLKKIINFLKIQFFQVPQWLLITFSACTVLLIAVHMLALMISTCILPNVEAVANLHFQTSKTVFESPHMKMDSIIELAWGFSTVIGILLFLVEIAILCWVKFYNVSPASAWVATGLLIPIMVIFISFAAHFYLKLVRHKSELSEDGIKELELLKGQLELSNAEEGGNINEEKEENKSTSAHHGLVQIV